jgi:hypothetical protein
MNYLISVTGCAFVFLSAFFTGCVDSGGKEELNINNETVFLKPIVGLSFGNVFCVEGILWKGDELPERRKGRDEHLILEVNKVEEKEIGKSKFIRVIGFDGEIEESLKRIIKQKDRKVRFFVYETFFASGLPENLPESVVIPQDHGWGVSQYLEVVKCEFVEGK